MAETFDFLDYLELPPGAGVAEDEFNIDIYNFGDVDPTFESRLGDDYPIDVPASKTATPGTPPGIQASTPLVPDPPSGELYSQQPQQPQQSQQPQPIGPQQIYGAPPAQPTAQGPDLSVANSLNIRWTASQQQRLNELLASDPILNPQLSIPPGYPPNLPPTKVQAYANFGIQQPLMGAHAALMHPQYMGTQQNPQQMHPRPVRLSYPHQWPAQQPSIPDLMHPMPQPIQQQPPIAAANSSRYHRRDSDSFTPQDLTRHSKQPPSPGLVSSSPSPKRPATNHHGVPLLNDKIPRKTHGKRGPEHIEPERYYGPSPPKPADWGPVDERGRHLFTYTEKGELAAGTFYTTRQMRKYIMGPSRNDDFEQPPLLPGVKRSKLKTRQGLTLWIGWPAAMANSRYPRGGESTKCRFESCEYGHTIQIGDPWVIMDERQNTDGEMIDPFHNAGYVHLFCLESHFDLVELWHYVDIRTDSRSFKRESHPYFSLNHKLPGIDQAVVTWWTKMYAEWENARALGLKRDRTHANSLAQCLIDFKLEHEPKAQKQNRMRRGGIDMSKHRGNPELKRKLLAFRKHGLLDDQGNPVPGADERLAELENSTKRRKGSKAKLSPVPAVAPSPHQSLVQNNDQQVYSTPTLSYTLPPSDAVAGQKRSRDGTDENANTTYPFHQAARELTPISNEKIPSPKRQRTDTMNPATAIPSPELTPPPDSMPIGFGDAGVKVGQGDDQPELDEEAIKWMIENFNDPSMGVGTFMDNGDLETFFDGEEFNRKPVDDATTTTTTTTAAAPPANDDGNATGGADPSSSAATNPSPSLPQEPAPIPTTTPTPTPTSATIPIPTPPSSQQKEVAVEVVVVEDRPQDGQDNNGDGDSDEWESLFGNPDDDQDADADTVPKTPLPAAAGVADEE